MSNEDAKRALVARYPVVLRSKFHTLHYKYVRAIRYTANDYGKIIVSLELVDYNNCVMIAAIEDVFIYDAFLEGKALKDGNNERDSRKD